VTHSETQRRANALRAEAGRLRERDPALADRLDEGARRLALRAAVRADDRARWRRPGPGGAESSNASERDSVAHGPDSAAAADAVAHGAESAENGPAFEGAPAPEGGVSSIEDEGNFAENGPDFAIVADAVANGPASEAHGPTTEAAP
jgi:hypothetical protein